jgi:hypothetical protein
MADYGFNQGGTYTPAVSSGGSAAVPNWAFSPGTGGGAGTAGTMGKMKFVNWGGRGLTSTGYRTRWARTSTDPTGAATALTLAKSTPITTATCAVASSFATTNPTIPTDPSTNLFAMDWNLLGGGGILVLPIGSEWMIVSSATAGTGYIVCQNVAGADANASTYGGQFQE